MPEKQTGGGDSLVSCPHNSLNSVEDEIIYSASYSRLKVVISLLIMMPLPIIILVGVIKITFIENDYISSILFALILISFIIIIIDSMAFKALFFYGDRIVKEYYLFGKITIYYSSAKIVGPPSGFKWLSSGYQIRKTDKTGKTILKQVPILFIAFFFSAKDSKSIQDIFNYLTDYSKENPRMIVTNRLHKGDL